MLVGFGLNRKSSAVCGFVLQSSDHCGLTCSKIDRVRVRVGSGGVEEKNSRQM